MDNVLDRYEGMFKCRQKKCKQQQDKFLTIQKQYNEKILAIMGDTKTLKKMEKLLSKTQAALEASACLIASCEKETVRLLDAISKEPLKKCGKENKALCVEFNKNTKAMAKQADTALQAIRKKDKKAVLRVSEFLNTTL